MIKKYLRTLLSSIFMLYIGTLASAGISYLLRLGVVIIVPSADYIWLRTLIIYLVMTIITAAMVFLSGSNSGYKIYRLGDKYIGWIPLLSIIPSLIIYIIVGVYTNFSEFSTGSINFLASLFCGIDYMETADLLNRPGAVISVISASAIQSGVYILSEIIGMKYGYRDRLEDDKAHIKLFNDK